MKMYWLYAGAPIARAAMTPSRSKQCFMKLSFLRLGRPRACSIFKQRGARLCHARPSFVVETAPTAGGALPYLYSCLILPHVVFSVGVGPAVPQLSKKS